MPSSEPATGGASRPDEFIRAALLLSILAHLAAFAFWKMPVKPIAMEGHRALTVLLLPRQHADTAKTTPPPPQEKPAEVQVEPEKPELPKPPPVTASRHTQPEKTDAPAPEKEPAKEQSQAAPSDPVLLNYIFQNADKAQALLLIGEDGSVQQIIWQQLPAVTEQELHEMERRLRQHSRMARGTSYTVPESIEIPRQ
jgi:cell division septation protein DedD